MSCTTIIVALAAEPSAVALANDISAKAQLDVSGVPVQACNVPDAAVPTLQAESSQPIVIAAPQLTPSFSAIHDCDAYSPLPPSPDEPDADVLPFYYGYELVPEDDIVFDSNASLVAKIQELINDKSYDSAMVIPSKGVFVDIPDCGVVFLLARQDQPITIGYIDGVGVHQPFQNGRAQVNKGSVTYKGKPFYVYAFAKYSSETVNFIQL